MTKKWTNENTAILRHILEDSDEKSCSITYIWKKYFANVVCYGTFARYYKIIMDMIGNNDSDKDKWTIMDTFILNNAMYNNLPLETIKSLFPGKSDELILKKMNRNYSKLENTDSKRKMIDGDCSINEYASVINKSNDSVSHVRGRYLAYQIIWSREDLEIIQKYYPIMNAKLIKFKFFSDNDSITPQVINRVGCELRLRKEYDNRRKWTDEEIDKLKKYYPVGGTKLCAKYIKRDSISINAKAKRLGIKAKPELKNAKRGSYSHYSIEELNIIKFFYPVLGPTMLQKTMMCNKTVTSIGRTARACGIYYDNADNDLKDFIKKNILQCSTEELAKRANVSEKTIKDLICRMKKLGLLNL